MKRNNTFAQNSYDFASLSARETISYFTRHHLVIRILAMTTARCSGGQGSIHVRDSDFFLCFTLISSLFTAVNPVHWATI